MGVQVVSSQGQRSGVKTDGAFLPRILLSGFLLVSVVGDSAFPGLQTSVRRETGPVYSAPSAPVPRCRHSGCAQLWCRAGGPVQVLQTCLLCSESCRAELPAEPLHRPRESRWPPMCFLHWGISCSVSDQNLSESVASSSSPRLP